MLNKLSRVFLSFSFASCFVHSQIAHASDERSFFSIAGTMAEEKSTYEGDTHNDAVTIFNLGLGIGISSGFFAGAKYFNYSKDDDLLDNDKVVISGYGPMLGFLHSSGFFISAAYLHEPTKTYKGSGGKTTFGGGSGYLIDIGKIWELGKSVGVGLQLTQSKTEYDWVKSNGSKETLKSEWSDTSFYPYLTIAFLF